MKATGPAPRSSLIPVVIALLVSTAVAAPVQAQSAQGGCSGDARFALLDFWVGEWDVYVGEQLVGTNRVEKVLSGCAVIEHWRDSSGGEGKSLFWYDRADGAWKQVWVTEQPLAPGGVKEKRHVETLDSGAVRFQGTIRLPEGGSYLDRTTLTPLEGGRVRQVIEVDRDGTGWAVGFDAVYVPRGTG
jgi:hypothetical protein